MKTKHTLWISLILGVIFLVACSKKSSKYDLSLIPVKSGDKWEYIDKDGKIVINPQFTFASLFHEEYALVATGGKGDSSKIGYINKEGKYIINPTYKSGTYFSEELACVVPEDGVPTYIDTKGAIKFTLKDAEKASIFSDGLACFTKLDKDGKELYGFIDKTGKVKITPIYYDAWSFSEELAPVKNKENKWGYINKEGTLIINFQFSDPGNYTDGKARVSDGKSWGYIDKNGKYLINPQFDDAYKFSQELAAIKQGKTWGFIDKSGKIVINPQFDDVWLFNEDLAAVRSSEKWGYIDKDGKYIINPQFDEITSFYGDIALVKSNGKVGIINKEGKYIVNPQFDDWSYELCASQECINGYNISNYSYYGNQIVETDYFDINSIVSSLITSITKTEFNTFNSSTKLDDLLKKLSIGDSVLPENNWSLSFEVKNKKLSRDITYNQIFNFKSKLKEPIKEVTGKDWYGDPIYKVTGYKKSEKALLSGMTYDIRLKGKAYKKVNVVIKAIVEKIEKAGLIKYEKPDEKGSIKYMLISDDLIIIIVSNDGYIGIGAYNSNTENFNEGLISIKKGTL